MFSKKAYAKVNLSLYITGKRRDGYHLLDTVMQEISLYDTVKISPNSDGKIKVISNIDNLSDENNICYSAAKLFLEEIDSSDTFSIEIEKNIPLAAGLGGGSSDAAAVLSLLNEIYKKPLTDKHLCSIALKLGADVPFFLKGGCARVTGIGENNEKIIRNLPIYMVLIKAEEKASTALMYKEFDLKAESLKTENRNDIMVTALKNNEERNFLTAVHNDFSLVWDYEKIKKDLESNNALKVSLSGSGPTVIGFYKNSNSAANAFEKLKQKYPVIFNVTAIGE
ncbi:MAG: 4-(cytidine 5'-diphospho)-2-C-methyl-D-erythritol kinase [Ruminococcaceae bacterium]|nr:4-(cytidine 5'-diphospho)-2-C-methyl-D-erythritol kinase [Oscillospiraceae bacterium]